MTMPEPPSDDYFKPLGFREKRTPKPTKDESYYQGYIKGFSRVLILSAKLNHAQEHLNKSDIQAQVEDFFKALGNHNAEIVLELIEQIVPLVIRR